MFCFDKWGAIAKLWLRENFRVIPTLFDFFEFISKPIIGIYSIKGLQMFEVNYLLVAINIININIVHKTISKKIFEN